MFEATTYEILRYDRVKRDQAAKTVDNTPFWGRWDDGDSPFDTDLD